MFIILTRDKWRRRNHVQSTTNTTTTIYIIIISCCCSNSLQQRSIFNKTDINKKNKETSTFTNEITTSENHDKKRSV